MIRRFINISFITILVGTLAYFFIQINHHSEVKSNTDLINVLPTNPALILETKQLKSFVNNSNFNSEMWSTLKSITPLNYHASTWEKWDSLSSHNAELNNWANSSAILSYHLIGQKAVAFLCVEFSNKASEKAFKLLLQNKSKQANKEYNGTTIFEIDQNKPCYYFFHDSYFAVSSSPILLEQSIRNIHKNLEPSEHFELIRTTKGAGADINAYVNYDRMQQIISHYSSNQSPLSKRIQNIGSWGEYDYSVNKNSIILNGFSNYNNDDYWQIFANQEATNLTIQEAIPASNSGFIAFSLKDMKGFRSDFENYLQANDQYTSYQNWVKSIQKMGHENLFAIFDEIIAEEFALIFDNYTTPQKKESLLVIKTHSASATIEQLVKIISNNGEKSESEYKNQLTIDSETSYDIYQYPFSDCFKYMYGDAFNHFKAQYFCMYENYLFFAETPSILTEAITANILKQNLINDTNFTEMFSSFSEKSSLFYFERTNNIIAQLNTECGSDFCDFNNIKTNVFSNFYGLSYQMVASKNMVYNSILINYNSNLKDKPLTIWNSQLDGNPVGKPVLVKNHYSNENEICIQDEFYNLYLISNSGRIIWKKPIGEPILGDVQQIDYFKNNKLQLIFNTANKLWILDRNGNHVERYPILLPNKASTGLSVFDYDNDRNYRIFIPTEDKHIYLYNKEGNLNNDFKFGNTEYALTRPIQHFCIGSNDYLIFADKNRVYILNRKGQERIKVKEQFSASPNNDFTIGKDEESYFLISDIMGQVKKIYTDGRVATIKLPEFKKEHYFAGVSLKNKDIDHFIIIEDNKLNVYNIKGKEVYSKRFEKAKLSRPYIYKFSSNTTKIGMVDYTNNEIYLINGIDGKMYKDFPLVGSTPFSIGFLATSAWRFNLIVGGENGSLYNYKVK